VIVRVVLGKAERRESSQREGRQHFAIVGSPVTGRGVQLDFSFSSALLNSHWLSRIPSIPDPARRRILTGVFPFFVMPKVI
jgi:hypothetical protein